MSKASTGTAPRVAVLIRAHNDQPRLTRSLESLCDDGAAFDVVVVDDGSTAPVVLPEGLSFPVELLRLARNRGAVGAANAGLAHIAAAGRYEYVAVLDAGDLSLPGRLGAQAAFLDTNPDHAAVGSAATFVDVEGQPLFVFRPPTTDAALRRFQRYRIGFVHSAMTLRLAALEELGFYDERFAPSEDYELALRLARRWKLANLSEVYVRYEVNPRSLSARRFRQGCRRLRAQVRHFEPRDPHAYVGVARNILLLFATRGLILGIKRRLAWS